MIANGKTHRSQHELETELERLAGVATAAAHRLALQDQELAKLRRRVKELEAKKEPPACTKTHLNSSVQAKLNLLTRILAKFPGLRKLK